MQSQPPHASTASTTLQQWAGGKMLSEIQGNVGIITFNRPEKHNAVSLEMWEALGDILSGFRVDEAVRVVVLRGAGEKAFVSGADISEFDQTRSSYDVEKEHKARIANGRYAVAEFPKPTIACIQGYCLGGGLGIALQADLRVAAVGSQLGIPAARLGIAYGFDDLRTLVSLVGPANARMIMFTAERIGAEEALRIGLVNRVVGAEDLWPHVLALAERIAENAPLSVTAAKSGIAQALRDPADRNLAEVEAFDRLCMDSLDYREGRTAFMEKRKPRFVGR